MTPKKNEQSNDPVARNFSFGPSVIEHVHRTIPTDPRPTVAIKMETNSRGTNWEISVSGCATPAEAIELVREARARIDQEFGASKEADVKRAAKLVSEAFPASDQVASSDPSKPLPPLSPDAEQSA